MQNIFREIQPKLSLTRRYTINFAPHLHDDIELVYVISGSVSAYCDGKEYPLTDGDFFLSFPNQIHHYAQCRRGDYIVLILKPSRLLYLHGIFADGQPQSAVCSGQAELATLLQTALEEFQQEGDSCAVDGYLTAFFAKLLKHYSIQKSNTSRSCVLNILQYCSSHFQEGISMQDVADTLHLSRSHISHIFSYRLKLSFSDYINSLRLSEAVKLMENQAFSMAEVAEKAGFPTIRTFNRVFAKQYNMSPSSYRKQCK